MKITALEPQKNNPERLNLHVDGEFRCGIALEIVMGAGLRVGDEITPERLAELERQDVRSARAPFGASQEMKQQLSQVLGGLLNLIPTMR